MNTFSNPNTGANQNENAALLTTPGAATIKAFSIVMNSLLQPQLLVEEVKKMKKITDTTFIDKVSDAPAEAEQETQTVLKAQGMVNHLKHTHSSNSQN